MAIIRAIIGNIDKYEGHELPNEFRYTEENALRPRSDLNARLKSKYFKMCQHEIKPNAQAFIWADGSYQIYEGITEWFLQELGSADAVFIRHPFLSSAREEMEFVEKGIQNGDPYLVTRYTNERISQQYACYKELGFPDTFLVCGGLFIRKNTPKVNNAFDDWFLENVKWTIEDQISLPYIIWKHKLDIKIIDSNFMLSGPYHKYVGHC